MGAAGDRDERGTAPSDVEEGKELPSPPTTVAGGSGHSVVRTLLIAASAAATCLLVIGLAAGLGLTRQQLQRLWHLPNGGTPGPPGAFPPAAGPPQTGAPVASSIRAVWGARDGISYGYQFPRNKQGIHDQPFIDQMHIQPAQAPEVMALRYKTFTADIAPGVRRYNAFWNGFESSRKPSGSPLTCAPGEQLVPANEGLRQEKGYHSFHCYNVATIQLFERYLSLDHSHGIQSCATIWGSPDVYRYQNCTGTIINGVLNFSPCVPRDDDSMLAFEDFVNFLADRFGRPGISGRFEHYIIWNEVGNGEWFDYSGVINDRQGPSPPDIAHWLDKYAAMMRAAHRAIVRHRAAPVMLWISLDQIWTALPCFGQGKCNIGGSAIVQGLWKRLGTSMDWSIAIHPYGDPSEDDWPGTYHFGDIEKLAELQIAELTKRNVTNPQLWPQAMIAATEQGWNRSIGEPALARTVCIAHDIAERSPNLVFVTHNNFQSTQPYDFGLVSRWAGKDLANATASLSYAAHASSHPQKWHRGGNHYCCKAANLGCQIPLLK